MIANIHNIAIEPKIDYERDCANMTKYLLKTTSSRKSGPVYNSYRKCLESNQPIALLMDEQAASDLKMIQNIQIHFEKGL